MLYNVVKASPAMSHVMSNDAVVHFGVLVDLDQLEIKSSSVAPL